MGYQQALEQTIGVPFTEENSVSVLRNGDEIFPAMLEAISNAKETISFLTFVYWKGEIADKFAELFAKKAKEGVKVRVLLDSYGAFPMKKALVELMQSSGVDVVWFRPLARWKVWKMDNRTHRKILICDGKIAFTGGVGIAEEWTGNARNESEWRDTHFKIEGPAVQGIKAAFIENWIEAGNELEINKSNISLSQKAGSTKIQTVRTSASVRWSDIVLLYQSLIELAEKRILIQTAYFNPDYKLVELLTKRAKEGIEVKIIFPGKYTDQRATKIIAGHSFEQLLEAGVELFYYQKTMMHAKVIMIDDELSCIGSANFNHRSMLKDDEINLVIIDSGTSQELRSHFTEDLENSERITNFRWKKRDMVKRVLEVIIRPFKQQL
ncbi:MAG TPA: cardiolipin synthase B [Balneola sp.]|mgnify:FL=1|jgi:cardiolipin synthase A/B|nr:cardiolipin synthase B [Balneola sp.]MAO77593.1 cardiolipin synthase B [Balneola sp.]MBF63801.1 cardiolipin synthase B [Balneola sp.]HBZ39747.1 cardiolipin synthase B [Balneola sp.]|tara:strand:+ start:6301 stop:7443 length:1143 start_codon:yes stop_codon:yes gene_type:complete